MSETRGLVPLAQPLLPEHDRPPALAGIPVGQGTYQWDGAAGAWFWVDPVNDLLYVGLIQRMADNSPPLQAITQTLTADAILG